MYERAHRSIAVIKAINREGMYSDGRLYERVTAHSEFEPLKCQLTASALNTPQILYLIVKKKIHGIIKIL